MNSVSIRAALKRNIERLTLVAPLLSTSVTKKAKNISPSMLHIIIPHRTNWPMTEASVRAFLTKTRRPSHISVINNFDPVPSTWGSLDHDHVSIVSHRFTRLGKMVRRHIRTENGSISNALAIDTALKTFHDFEWAFMAHNDSAPLVKDWDDHFFEALRGSKIVGNYRDRCRIQAAHASGTLFSQRDFLESRASMAPVFRNGDWALDVGDQASVVLHQKHSKAPVNVLPNTVNSPELIEKLESSSDLIAFAKSGSTITFDSTAKIPVFMHLGRGTIRPTSDTSSIKGSASRLPTDAWIHLLQVLS